MIAWLKLAVERPLPKDPPPLSSGARSTATRLHVSFDARTGFCAHLRSESPTGCFQREQPAINILFPRGSFPFFFLNLTGSVLFGRAQSAPCRALQMRIFSRAPAASGPPPRAIHSMTLKVSRRDRVRTSLSKDFLRRELMFFRWSGMASEPRDGMEALHPVVEYFS